MKYGPRIVKVIAANPSEDLITEITGWKSYGKRETDVTTRGSRIIGLLVQDSMDEQFHFWDFFIKDEVIQSRSGKKMYSNEFGQISFYVDSLEECPEYIRNFNPKVVREGEEFVTTLLQFLSHYQPDPNEVPWRESMYNFGCSVENLSAGNVTGLNELLDFYYQRGSEIGCLFTDRNGFQHIETHKDTIFPVIDREVPPSYMSTLEGFIKGFNPLQGNIDLYEVINKYLYENG